MSNHDLLEEGLARRTIAGQEVVTTYGNEEAARRATREGSALVNRSHWGLLRLTGSMRLAFLHNLTTNDINRLKAGEAVESVFLTSTARIVDLVTVLATEEALWLITSPERREILTDWIPRFIFFNDDVQLSDESEGYAIFSLLGPESSRILAALGGEGIVEAPQGHHAALTLAGVDGVRVMVGGGLPGEGYTLLVPTPAAAAFWQTLREAGAEPMGVDLWESLRIEAGRPAADREITEEYNPLEAGLWQAVSFAKGCYIGQEVVARLDTYQKLKQQLWGLRLSAPVQPGTPVIVEDKEVGKVTSVTETAQGPFALAYVRTKAGGEGGKVQVGEATGEIVELPFLTRGRNDI